MGPANWPYRTAVEATRLTEFLPKYNILRKAFQDMSWRNNLQLSTKIEANVRVAIIDTGVDPGSIKCSRIRGASFIPSGTGGGESPWWFSQYPHGTQVAKIITEIDPYCELLVAKVGDAHRDMTTQRVTEVYNSSPWFCTFLIPYIVLIKICWIQGLQVGYRVQGGYHLDERHYQEGP
jgi:hypothetical protein